MGIMAEKGSPNIVMVDYYRWRTELPNCRLDSQSDLAK